MILLPLVFASLGVTMEVVFTALSSPREGEVLRLAAYAGHRWAVDGLIRLDYAPAWMAACWIFERVWVGLGARLAPVSAEPG